MIRALPAIVALVLLAMPAAARAQPLQTNAPPGNSAIDEYLETVPSATGNQRPRQPGTAGASHVLTTTERARLEQLGPDGRALATAIDATAPPASKPDHRIDLDSGQGRSPISAVIDTAVGSDGGAGMGFLLPVILVGSLLGVLLVVVLRRRSVS